MLVTSNVKPTSELIIEEAVTQYIKHTSITNLHVTRSVHKYPIIEPD